MAIQGLTKNCCTPNMTCPSKDGCPPNVCPVFEIRRHDTMPPWRLSVSDCNGPLDLTGCIAEVSMWALAKLKKEIIATDTFFALADDIGFQQINIGDVIVMDRVRNPEQMVVIGFDENLKLIEVQRGHNGTQPGVYKKGHRLRIFRILNAVAETNTVTEDIKQVDGTTQFGVITDAQLIYNWLPADTCLPGCFYFEFKLLKMTTPSSMAFWPNTTPLLGCPVSCISAISAVPSFISVLDGCDLGSGVDWVRRFPQSGEGFLIKIWDTATAENVF